MLPGSTLPAKQPTGATGMGSGDRLENPQNDTSEKLNEPQVFAKRRHRGNEFD